MMDYTIQWHSRAARRCGGRGVGALGGLAHAAGRRGGILRISYPFQPTSLDPVFGRQNGDFDFLYPVFETLVDWEPTTMLAKPALATRWDLTDPTTFVLKLRENVAFHDGTRFDAKAAKFNLDRCMNEPKSNAKATRDRRQSRSRAPMNSPFI